jgi:membrane carboxypeptidase/penicillin-binding protein
MGTVLKDVPAEQFLVPEGIDLVEIDPESGLLASPGCYEKVVESFLPGTSPTEYCDHSGF